jgi:hypothetical protein
MPEKFPKIIIHLGPFCYQYILLFKDGKKERSDGPDMIERLAKLAGISVERSGDETEEYK